MTTPMLSPAFVAVGNHEVAAVRRMLDDGADPNAWSPLHGQSLLFIAAQVHDLTLVRLLLERGADPNQRLTIHSLRNPLPGRDVTVLMYAPTAGIAQALIEFGADVDAQDHNGTTALINAAYFGRIDVLRVLLDCGADATIKTALMSAAFWTGEVPTPMNRRKPTALDLAEFNLRWWGARLETSRFWLFPPELAAERFHCYQEIVSLLRTVSRYPVH